MMPGPREVSVLLVDAMFLFRFAVGLSRKRRRPKESVNPPEVAAEAAPGRTTAAGAAIVIRTAQFATSDRSLLVICHFTPAFDEQSPR
jgi:hypothetical protein